MLSQPFFLLLSMSPNCIFLLGDFNAKHNSWDASTVTNSAGTGLYNLALEFSLTQCVTEHTRFSADGRHRNILDLLLTNRPDLILENSVTAPISDHCCVTSKFRTLQLESKTKTMLWRSYSESYKHDLCMISDLFHCSLITGLLARDVRTPKMRIQILLAQCLVLFAS